MEQLSEWDRIREAFNERLRYLDAND